MKNVTQLKSAMRDHKPTYYHGSLIAMTISDKEAEEIGAYLVAAYDLLNQFFIDSATWGLARWEKAFSIKPLATATYEQRREVLKAKLRSVGDVSTEMIKTVAESFGNGSVDVSVDIPNQTVNISFTSVVGVPTQLTAVKESIREIIPAHLDLTFTLKYLLIREIHGVMTLAQIEQRKLSDFAGGAIK